MWISQKLKETGSCRQLVFHRLKAILLSPGYIPEKKGQILAKGKVGLDYFTLDCCLNDKIKLIEAEFGLKGFAVIVKLWMKIYGERGYYCEWNDDVAFLFMASIGGNSCVDKKLIDEIVAASIRRGIFSKQLYEQYGILTSKTIQENYFDAVSRRIKVEVKKEYLLVKVGQNFDYVDKKEENVDRNSENVCRKEQSRVEESKVDNIYHVHSSEMHDTEIETFFESIWKLYPVKKGKGKISKAKKKTLFKIGYEKMQQCIERFMTDMQQEQRDTKYWMHGSTFFNSGYIDYLDGNYVPGKKVIQKPKRNSFNNFNQRQYDYNDLEKKLLAAGHGGESSGS